MATPLSATGRIVIQYTIQGFVHKFRVYVRGLTAVGATWNINSRTVDANDVVWTDAAHDLEENVSWILCTGTTFSDATLEQYTGGVWITRATFTPTITNHINTAHVPGWGAIAVLRDINFKKVKLVVSEGNTSSLFHTAAYSALSGNSLNFIKEWTANKTLTNAPYNWAVGRGNQFLNTSPFVGLTFAPNRKTRRRRGLT